MKKALAVAALILGCSLSFSTIADTGECKIDPGWSSKKINQTINDCRNTTEKVVQENVESYSDLAKNVAVAVGIAAKEIGVATNEFIKTDAGKLTVGLIVWHVFGDEIKSIIFGIPALFVIFWVGIRINRAFRHDGEYIERDGWFKKTKYIPKLCPLGDLTENQGLAWGLLMLVMCIASVALFLTIIN